VRPLKSDLEQRRERTEEAILKARADVAADEAKTQEYERRLREAKLAVFKTQETPRQAARKARAAAVAEARERAQEQIRGARAAIEQDVAVARQSLQSEADRLAREIIRTILKHAGVASEAGGAS
jgi:F-type H+-transporting ATPase subunit b